MKQVFAILQEPASYTVARNQAVYDKMGIEYRYLYSSSLAKSDEAGQDKAALSALSTVALAKQLARILKDNHIVIMNGYTGKTFILLYLLNIIYRRAIGIDSDTQLYIPRNPIKRLLKRMYLSAIFKNKRIFGLAGGSQTHKELFRHYGMDESRICLMPMVVDNASFKKEPPCHHSPFRFLYVGRIIEVKNIERMIQAFVSEFGNDNHVKLRIVGNGNLFEPLTKKYGTHPNVDFAGPKYGKSLVEEYRNASAFILPSSYEPWGLVVNEAMSAGLPVIVSDQVGAAWDLVKDKNTGLIFRYDDAGELARQMRLLVRDRELHNKFSISAYDLMHNHWNYEFYSECLKKFIDKASLAK